MAWVVDTCVVIDVLENDPAFGQSSAGRLQDLLGQGLVLCPVSMVELSPAFGGDISVQKEFLGICGIDYHQSFTALDCEMAHTAWNRYIIEKRASRTAKRPVADILIGAFAMRFEGLVTRNPGDFRPWFERLAIIVP